MRKEAFSGVALFLFHLSVFLFFAGGDPPETLVRQSQGGDRSSFSQTKTGANGFSPRGFTPSSQSNKVSLAVSFFFEARQSFAGSSRIRSVVKFFLLFFIYLLVGGEDYGLFFSGRGDECPGGSPG